MLTLPKELQQAVLEADAQPLRIVDAETDVEYVLLPAERFYRYYEYDDSPITTEAQEALLVEMGLRAGWDEPEMDIYNKLVPRRKSDDCPTR